MNTHDTSRRGVLRGIGAVALGSVWAGTAAGDEARNVVTVRAVDSRTGDPVTDFAVSIGGGLPERDQVIPTDRDGVVKLCLPDGTHEIRAAAYPEFMHAVRSVVLDGEDVSVTLALPPGPAYDGDDRGRDDEGEHTLTIHIAEAENGDVLSGDVIVTDAETGEYQRAHTQTGSVQFAVDDGVYNVDADVEGYRVVSDVTRTRVEVDGDDETITMELFRERETRTLTVTVLDADTGDSIEGAQIGGVGGAPGAADALMGGVTDADGVAVIEALRPISPYDTSISAEGYETETRFIELQDDEELTVELSPAS